MNVQRTLIAMTLASSIALIASGCPGGGGEAGQADRDPAATQPGEATPPGNADDDGSHPPEEIDDDFTAKEDTPPKAAHMDKTFRVVVEATFSELPAGAVVVAPSARDRRYQKVTKSDHQGLPGSVMPTESGDNLFYISDPIKAGAGELKYVGTFETTRRVGTQGDVAASKGAAYDAGMGTVVGASTDAAIVAAAKALGEGLQPHDALLKAVASATAMKQDDAAGSDVAGDVIGGEPASRFGIAAATSELLKASGVPSRVVQGLYQPDVPGIVNKGHAWIDAELPRLGWVPVDPVLRREGAGDAASSGMYLGLIPSDRITMVVGTSAVIPAEEGIVPRLELSGPLAHPFAIKDGKRVGKVSWTARFEPLSDGGDKK